MIFCFVRDIAIHLFLLYNYELFIAQMRNKKFDRFVLAAAVWNIGCCFNVLLAVFQTSESISAFGSYSMYGIK